LGYAYTAGGWVGNDFDLATIAARNVGYLLILSTPNWPNSWWDGFRVGLFSFAGGVPGPRLWPTGTPYYFRPTTGGGWQWVQIGVNWKLPGGTSGIVGAAEQYYNPPNCDPFGFDTGPSAGHGWRYYGGSWTPFNSWNANLMLRVTLVGDAGVAPSSFGRVKALYR